MGALFWGRSADVEHERRAAVILDSTDQFVALLSPRGDILEVNRAALEGAGHRIEEIRGKPFWSARWWQVSEQIREELKAAIRRAATGEFIQYEVQVFGEKAGLSPITIDFSLRPIRGESGEIEFLLPEGKNITELKEAQDELALRIQELRGLNERIEELDRRKTQFFANVCHECRTVSTLMLSPLEDTLAILDTDRQPDVTTNLAIVHRNAYRLLKLVNTMLDFSRIEAGHVQASYQPTDIAAFTTELVSNFRSACEKGGLRLTMECAPFETDKQAYLDRDMWEKIVLNLMSNACKFTFSGDVEVRLAQIDGHARLTVRDTGIGIPRDELPYMFERFHRINRTQGRTHEGTGIGLALVHELVKLHSGAVTVDSEMGKGSTFTVTIPLGKAHLDPENVSNATELVSTGAVVQAANIEEALRWLPYQSKENGLPSTIKSQLTSNYKSAGIAEGLPRELTSNKPRILWADNNADMRSCVSRLLASRYDVWPVADGEAALEAARGHLPDLVLSDVMMPRLDGFGLLRALRDDPELREIPVMLFSAHAEEESRVEGFEAGADDYLVKPFTARELIARMESHIRMANVRRQATDREFRLRTEAEFEKRRFQRILGLTPAAIGLTTGSNHQWVYVNEQYIRLTGRSSSAQFIGKTIRDCLPEIEGQGFHELMDEVYRTGRSCRHEMKAVLDRSDTGEPNENYWDFVYQAVRDAAGKVEGILIHSVEVTDRVIARQTLEQSEERFRTIFQTTPECVKMVASDGALLQMNAAGLAIIGAECAATVVGKNLYNMIAPEDRDRFKQFNERICRGEKGSLEFDIIGLQGIRRHMETHGAPLRNPDGEIVHLAITRDVTDGRSAEDARRHLAAIVESSEDAIISKDLNGFISSWNPQAERMFGYTEEEMLGQPIINIIPPELRSDEQLILGKIKSGQKIEHHETVRVAKTGERIDVSLSISPVKDEQGRVVGAAKIARDIREQKRIEHAMRTTEKLAAAGRVAATVAHEINNPLQAATNLVYLAESELPDADRVAAHLISAKRELDRVAHIARQTLDFFRESTSPIRMNFASSIDELLLLYEKRLEVRNIKIVKQFDRNAEAMALAGKIRQALSNLLTNSMDAMSSSGGTLTIRVRQTHRWNNSNALGVRITIADTGNGITSEAMRNLFQPFFTTKADIGTGLGLWITRGIVDKHDGIMNVKSRTGIENHGTVVSMLIPSDGKQDAHIYSLSDASNLEIPVEALAR